MGTFTKQEYLELVSKLAEQQYDQLIDDDEEEYIEWSPSEPEIREKPVRVRSDATTDLTNAKKSALPDLIFKSTNLKVHNFTIKITTYHGEPDDKGATLNVGFTLYHEVNKTPNLGAPCKMTYACNVYKDDRFKNRPWLKFFDTATGSHATDIPTETLIDIIRWIQVVVKYPAFL